MNENSDEYISQTIRMKHEAQDAAERDALIILLVVVAAAFWITLRYLV